MSNIKTAVILFGLTLSLHAQSSSSASGTSPDRPGAGSATSRGPSGQIGAPDTSGNRNSAINTPSAQQPSALSSSSPGPSGVGAGRSGTDLGSSGSPSGPSGIGASGSPSLPGSGTMEARVARLERMVEALTAQLATQRQQNIGSPAPGSAGIGTGSLNPSGANSFPSGTLTVPGSSSSGQSSPAAPSTSKPDSSPRSTPR